MGPVVTVPRPIIPVQRRRALLPHRPSYVDTSGQKLQMVAVMDHPHSLTHPHARRGCIPRYVTPVEGGALKHCGMQTDQTIDTVSWHMARASAAMAHDA